MRSLGVFWILARASINTNWRTAVITWLRRCCAADMVVAYRPM